MTKYFAIVAFQSEVDHSVISKMRVLINLGTNARRCSEVKKNKTFVMLSASAVDEVADGENLKIKVQNNDFFDIELDSSGDVKIDLPWPSVAHLFYYEGRDFSIVSSEYRLIKKMIPEEENDLKAIGFFLSFGYTPARKTFSKKINMLLGGDTLSIVNGSLVIRESKTCIDEESGATWRDIYDAYKRSLRDLCEELKPTHCTLTGGVDSRLNVLSLRDIDWSYRLVYWLDLGAIKDEAVARSELEAAYSVVERYGLRLSLGYPDDVAFDKSLKGHSKYIKSHPWDLDSHNYSITGIYGTELLGGSCFNFAQNYPNCLDEIGRTSLSSLVTEPENLSRKELFHSVTTTFCSSLYRSEHWMHPWLQIQRKPTPFLRNDFLYAWFSAPREQIEEYSCVKKIFSTIHPYELTKYPVCSTLAYFWPDVRVATGATLQGLYVPRSNSVPATAVSAITEELFTHSEISMFSELLKYRLGVVSTLLYNIS